jgi:hypothetical protein
MRLWGPLLGTEAWVDRLRAQSTACWPLWRLLLELHSFKDRSCPRKRKKHPCPFHQRVVQSLCKLGQYGMRPRAGRNEPAVADSPTQDAPGFWVARNVMADGRGIRQD